MDDWIQTIVTSRHPSVSESNEYVEKEERQATITDYLLLDEFILLFRFIPKSSDYLWSSSRHAETRYVESINLVGSYAALVVALRMCVV